MWLNRRYQIQHSKISVITHPAYKRRSHKNGHRILISNPSTTRPRRHDVCTTVDHGHHRSHRQISVWGLISTTRLDGYRTIGGRSQQGVRNNANTVAIDPRTSNLGQGGVRVRFLILVFGFRIWFGSQLCAYHQFHKDQPWSIGCFSVGRRAGSLSDYLDFYNRSYCLYLLSLGLSCMNRVI